MTQEEESLRYRLLEARSEEERMDAVEAVWDSGLSWSVMEEILDWAENMCGSEMS